jgi:hypothetical protein
MERGQLVFLPSVVGKTWAKKVFHAWNDCGTIAQVNRYHGKQLINHIDFKPLIGLAFTTIC